MTKLYQEVNTPPRPYNRKQRRAAAANGLKIARAAIKRHKEKEKRARAVLAMEVVKCQEVANAVQPSSDDAKTEALPSIKPTEPLES